MIGVLALQGDVREHESMLQGLGVSTRQVRMPADLEGLDGLIIPGGESTTIGRLATLYGLMDPLRQAIVAGLPTYGTCAGLILLADRLSEGTQPLLGALDVAVRRNAFGNQNDSFEADLDVAGLHDPFHAVFIRVAQRHCCPSRKAVSMTLISFIPMHSHSNSFSGGLWSQATPLPIALR